MEKWKRCSAFDSDKRILHLWNDFMNSFYSIIIWTWLKGRPKTKGWCYITGLVIVRMILGVSETKGDELDRILTASPGQRVESEVRLMWHNGPCDSYPIELDLWKHEGGRWKTCILLHTLTGLPYVTLFPFGQFVLLLQTMQAFMWGTRVCNTRLISQCSIKTL